MITKDITPFLGVKGFAIMKLDSLAGLCGGAALGGMLSALGDVRCGLEVVAVRLRSRSGAA